MGDETSSTDEKDTRKAADGMENDETEKKSVQRWVHRQRKRVRRDVDGLVRVVRSLLPKNSTARGIPPKPPMDDDDGQRIVARVATKNMQRHPSVDPDVVGLYDIAIVLTGFNDLKDAFLPFMMSAQRAKLLREAGGGDVQGALLRILHALEEKMQIRLPRRSEERSAEDECQQPPVSTAVHELVGDISKQRAPLVVFPALPVAPIEMSHTVPLCWFLLPIIRALDYNKRILAEMYPGLVVFVAAPSDQVMSELEARRGLIWENMQKEHVLLQLTDAVLTGRDRVEGTMKQHYRSWFLDAGEEEEDTLWGTVLYEIELDGVCSARLVTKGKNTHPGATMVSCDGIHPSDSGYVI
jgi:hypothetical protein